jgi:Fur family ferric uptake transcriptional regulator/Fur family peroxide stress response transcriptional regulator
VPLTEPRLTPQRRAVLEVLRESPDHPTAIEVYERVRARASGIGAATVYRTLALLVATGQAHELNFDSGAARYDANTDRHDHLICLGCGSATDIQSPIPATAVAEIASDSGYAVSGYDLRFRGFCPDCQAAGLPASGPPDRPSSASTNP